MAEFQKSKKIQNIIYSRGVTFILAALSIVLIVGLFNIIPKERETNQNKNSVLKELDSLKSQNASLGTEIKSLKTEEGIEEKIREKFRVVKEGEGLVVIVDEKPKDKDGGLQPAKSGGFLNFLKKIFMIE